LTLHPNGWDGRTSFIANGTNLVNGYSNITFLNQLVMATSQPQISLFTEDKSTSSQVDSLCQPYSQAGKRLGKEDDRHLWPEMLRAIREIQPSWVVGENVLGLVNWNGGLVFDEVQADLENEGYVVQPYVLPACAVNAPHRRDRVWFVAHSAGARNGNNGRGRNLCEGNKLFQESKWEKNKQWDKSLSQSGLTTNSDHTRTVNAMRDNGNGAENDKGRQVEPQSESWAACGNDSNTADTGIKSGRQAGKNKVFGFKTASKSTFVGWDKFPTKSPVCGSHDGIPRKLDAITFPKWREESVKAYGNAIVPQVAHQIFKAIEQYECQASPNP
jgi:DNA (cytosine-5)-methyltransferase 1